MYSIHGNTTQFDKAHCCPTDAIFVIVVVAAVRVATVLVAAVLVATSSASASRTKVYFEELLGFFQAHQSVVAAVGSSLASPTANLAGTYPSGLETIRGSFCQTTSSG